jgi:hypothetical protein
MDSSLHAKSSHKEESMLMLKRLNYLRNALENHSAKETTAHLREVAEKRRDERIMELWKSDLEKPSVGDVVDKMRGQVETSNQQSSQFMAMLESIQTGGALATPGELPMLENGSQASMGTSGMAKTGYGHRQVAAATEAPVAQGRQSQASNSNAHTAAHMSQTMQANIQRGKITSSVETAYKPLKARVEHSERTEFWADFKAPQTQVKTSSKFLRDKKQSVPVGTRGPMNMSHVGRSGGTLELPTAEK